MDIKPRVSIVMSVYNGAKSLPETLESILTQEGLDLEFIVVNDGSTDDTLQILDKYAGKDKRLKVLNQENQGLTRSLIRGCAEAKGEYIARQDAGDVSLYSRLAKQAAMLQAEPRLVLVSCDYVLVTPNGEIMIEKLARLDTDADAITLALRSKSEELRGPHHGTVMFRKSAYESSGGYRDAFYYAQDLDLWTRMIEIGDMAFIPEVLCRTQFAIHSLSGRFRDEQQLLKSLIAEAACLRRDGCSDEAILNKARQIRPSDHAKQRSGKKIEASAAYFIGSCLADRGDPAAQKYFRQALIADPLYLKAWLKMIRSTLQIPFIGVSGK